MKRRMVLAVLAILVGVQWCGAAGDVVAPYRPSQDLSVPPDGLEEPGLFYVHANNLAGGGGWVEGIDQSVWYGWAGVTAYWADFNGDGVDDKTFVQSAGAAPPFWSQIVVAYSGIDGDISNVDFNPPNGDIQTTWQQWPNPDSPTGYCMLELVFGDIDGDGIDDNAALARQTSTPEASALNWGAYLSGGAPGVSTSNWLPWAAYGVEADEAALGDINGDGYADRIIWHHEVWPDPCSVETLYVWLGADYSGAGAWGDGVVDEYALLYVGPTAEYTDADASVGVTDIDGDGMDDIVLIRRDLAMDYFELFGWYTNAANLTGDGLPATQAWGGIADAAALGGTVSLADEILFAQLAPSGSPSDLNGDGNVDYADVAVLTSQWLDRRGVLNGSFEDPALPDGGVAYGVGGSATLGDPTVPPGWDNNIFNDPCLVIVKDPNASDPFDASDGENYVWFEIGAQGNIAQFEGGYYNDFLVEPNTVYTMTVDVGVPADFSPAAGHWYQVKFVGLDDSDGLVFRDPLAAVNHGTNFPTLGDWTTVSVSFNSGLIAPSVVGYRLLLVLEGNYVAYDHVRFSKQGFPDYNHDNVITLPDWAEFSAGWNP